jgi:hypothetical protein
MIATLLSGTFTDVGGAGAGVAVGRAGVVPVRGCANAETAINATKKAIAAVARNIFIKFSKYSLLQLRR